MRAEDGSVLPFALIGGSVLIAAAVVAGAAVSGSATHTRAEAVADLAAIAGAAALLDAPGPCPAAGRTANSNGARLASCVVHGAVVRVEVRVAVPAGLARLSGRDEARGAAAAELVPPQFGGESLPQQG